MEPDWKKVRLSAWLRQYRHRDALLLTLAAIAFLLALGMVIRVSALPVEARTSEVWYAYEHQLDYDFTAHVLPGQPVYPDPAMSSGDLHRRSLPVEPPVYRRVVLARLADRLVLHLPYRYIADRPADLTVTYRVDGRLVVPNLWERPYPLLPEQRLQVANAAEVSLEDLRVEIPIRTLLEELAVLSDTLRVSHDQAEIRVRPVIRVEVAGVREPVTAELTPDIRVYVRGLTTAVELDEPRRFDGKQSFSVTRIEPVTVNLLGRPVRVATLRWIALLLLGVCTVVLAVVLLRRWLRRRSARAVDLRQLGPALITAAGVTLPEGATIVEVESPQQLLALHLQTERPVIRVGETYYLLDGLICYCLMMAEPGAEPPSP